jgi:hypothetical protein
MRFKLCLFFCSLLLIALRASAEVTVSLNISGDMDEIRTILDLLQRLELGKGSYEADDPFRLRVHSIHKNGDMKMTSPSVETDTAATGTLKDFVIKPEPALALRHPAVAPAAVTPGIPALITVEVVDRKNAIDTLAATLPKIDRTVDLYDNGTHGDVKGNDGIWSVSFLLPAQTSPASYAIDIAAYDANGDPIMTIGKDQQISTLVTSTEITVKPRE